eukprot:NODE_49_length_27162_cov_0.380039.p6 type:complete len:433 gc:universal NODE_49_length_27162_cov_0.380039:16193-14895(-)
MSHMFLIFIICSYGSQLDIGKTTSLNIGESGTTQFIEFSVPSSFQKQSLFSSAISNTYDKTEAPGLVFGLLLCNGSMPNAYLSVNPEPNENQFDIQVRETQKGVRQVTILGVASSTIYLTVLSTGKAKANLHLGYSLQNDNGTLIDWSDSNSTTSIFRQLPNSYNHYLNLAQYDLSFYVTENMNAPVLSYCYIETNYKKQNISLFEANPRKYLVADGLTKNSQYLGFLLIKRNDVRDVFTPIAFYTLNNEDCSLVYGGSMKLNVCASLARTIPNPKSGTISSLVSQWESYVDQFLGNFTQVLGAFDCANTKYSMVRSCNDCKFAYTDWICRQLIPRCVRDDVPSPPNSFRSNRWISVEETVQENNLNAFNTTPYKSQVSQVKLNPFRRALSCISFCEAVVQSCPTFSVDYAPYKLLNCPDENDLITFGYASC